MLNKKAKLTNLKNKLIMEEFESYENEFRTGVLNGPCSLEWSDVTIIPPWLKLDIDKLDEALKKGQNLHELSNYFLAQENKLRENNGYYSKIYESLIEITNTF